MDAEEILNHVDFPMKLQHHIDLFTINRPKLVKGQKYKRGPIDSLKEKGLLTVGNVLNEFNNVCAKSSKLSAVERAAIEDLIIYAAKDILKDYENRQNKTARTSDGAVQHTGLAQEMD